MKMGKGRRLEQALWITVAICEFRYFGQKQRLCCSYLLCALLNEPMVRLAADLEIILSVSPAPLGGLGCRRALIGILPRLALHVIKQLKEILAPFLPSFIQEPELMERRR